MPDDAPHERPGPGDLPPFLAGLIDFVQTHPDAWVAPGHRGGHLLERHPAGRELLGLLGRAYDVDRLLSTHALGDPLDPGGPLAEAQRHAAATFCADRCHFVTNGTSTAVKIVVQATVAHGDRVLLDANCHKSVHHAVTLAGAVPTLLPAGRADGNLMAPPVPGDVPDVPEGHFALAVVTHPTYDGLADVTMPLLRRLGRVARHVLFDEAWVAHAVFDERYAGRHLMGNRGLTDLDPALIVTQSLHKTLAGLSQCAQILIDDRHCRPARKLAPDRLLTALRMHSSTSPQFALVAALETSARIFRDHGKRWVGAAINEMARVRNLVPSPWGVWEGGGWQDPLKLTLLPPPGLPGHLAKRLLKEEGVLAEKAGAGSVLLTAYPALDAEMGDRLVRALARVAERWEGDRVLRRKAADLTALLDPDAESAAASALPEYAMPPAEAHAAIARGTAERVAVGDLAGRVVATEVMPYPPGVVLFPAGTRAEGPRLDLLRLHARLLDRFPDLAPSLHGVDAGHVLCVPR